MDQYGGAGNEKKEEGKEEKEYIYVCPIIIMTSM